jgi:predicted TIM-barrel fold metal-dependent hydrolase
MDAAGVRLGLLSAWHGPSGPLIANDEVAAWVEQHPGRCDGLAAVDLARPMAAVRELRRCVGELGFKGLRVIPWLWEAPPTDRRYYPLYAACVELGVPVAYLRTRSGSRKVMFGSNHPMIAPQQALEHLDALRLDDETRAHFVQGNAERVFGL